MAIKDITNTTTAEEDSNIVLHLSKYQFSDVLENIYVQKVYDINNNHIFDFFIYYYTFTKKYKLCIQTPFCRKEVTNQWFKSQKAISKFMLEYISKYANELENVYNLFCMINTFEQEIARKNNLALAGNKTEENINLAIDEINKTLDEFISEITFKFKDKNLDIDISSIVLSEIISEIQYHTFNTIKMLKRKVKRINNESIHRYYFS